MEKEEKKEHDFLDCYALSDVGFFKLKMDVEEVRNNFHDLHSRGEETFPWNDSAGSNDYITFSTINYKGAITEGSLNVVGFGHKCLVLDEKPMYQVLFFSEIPIGHQGTQKGDSGAPYFSQDGCIHSFHQGSVDVIKNKIKEKLCLSTPANLALKQIKRLTGSENLKFCRFQGDNISYKQSTNNNSITNLNKCNDNGQNDSSKSNFERNNYENDNNNNNSSKNSIKNLNSSFNDVLCSTKLNKNNENIKKLNSDCNNEKNDNNNNNTKNADNTNSEKNIKNDSNLTRELFNKIMEAKKNNKTIDADELLSLFDKLG
jgi:hypothetical protein